jgi:hypothetical protein
MPGIYDPKYRRTLALLQGENEANIELARRRTQLQYDELGPIELEQNVDDVNKIADEKDRGLGVELRPLRGLPPINRGGMKELMPGAGWTTVVQNYHSPPEDAEMIAVSVGVGNRALSEDIASKNQVERIDLHVEWGMGGANFDVELDGYDGLVFCLPACKLKVDARYRQVILPNVPPPVISVPVNVGLAYGTFIEQSCPTRLTEDLGIIPNGGAAQDTIPPFATSFTLLCAPAAIVGPPPFPLIAQPPTSIVVSETPLVTAAERKAYFELTDNTNLSLHVENQFPRFNGAKVITVTNNSAAPARYTLIYNLAF